MARATQAPQCEEQAQSPRGRIYALLANVLTSPPTADSVRRVRAMAEVLGIDCPAEWPLRELEQEYGDLFVVPSPKYAAPYESVYRDAWLLPCAPSDPSQGGSANVMVKGLVMGESTLAVRRCYLDAGLVPAEELPDHIGNELRFMAYLWHREAEAPSRNGEPMSRHRARFRDEHLLKWIGPLRERILKSERLGFYSMALQVVEVVLQNDP